MARRYMNAPSRTTAGPTKALTTNALHGTTSFFLDNPNLTMWTLFGPNGFQRGHGEIVHYGLIRAAVTNPARSRSFSWLKRPTQQIGGNPRWYGNTTRGANGLVAMSSLFRGFQPFDPTWLAVRVRTKRGRVRCHVLFKANVARHGEVLCYLVHETAVVERTRSCPLLV